MPPLTQEQIEALQAAGGNLWEKYGKRRLYFQERPPLQGMKKLGLKMPKTWMDLDTGEVYSDEYTLERNLRFLAEQVAGIPWEKPECEAWYRYESNPPKPAFLTRAEQDAWALRVAERKAQKEQKEQRKAERERRKAEQEQAKEGNQ